MKLSALGEDGKILTGHIITNCAPYEKALKETGRLRRMRGMKLCAVGEGAQ